MVHCKSERHLAVISTGYVPLGFKIQLSRASEVLSAQQPGAENDVVCRNFRNLQNLLQLLKLGAGSQLKG